MIGREEGSGAEYPTTASEAQERPGVVVSGEAERRRRLLAEVTKYLGSRRWGACLQLGRPDPQLTTELVRRCSSVTVCVLEPADSEASVDSSPSPCVPVCRWDQLEGRGSPVYDLVLATNLQDIIGDMTSWREIVVNLPGCLRQGGLLVLSEELIAGDKPQGRIRPPGSGRPAVCRKLIEVCPDLHLVHEVVQSQHLIALVVNSGRKRQRSDRWKGLVPARLRAIYRAARMGLRLVRGLNWSSPVALVDSLRLARVLLLVREDSLLDEAGLKSLYQLARDVDARGIAGDFLECGVYRGGSAAMLGYAVRRSRLTRQLWLFDSFQGLPAPTEADGPYAPPLAGELVGDHGRVKRLLQQAGAPSDRVHIVAGWFHETLPRTPITRVAFLHIDADWYESVKACLERFYNLLAPGAVVVLDDYDEWPGCRAAFEDFVHARSLELPIKRTASGTPYFAKPGQ